LEGKVDVILKEKLLMSGTDILVHSASSTEHTISLDLLESVAKIRYCLRVVADVLQLHSKRHDYGHMVHRLLEECRYTCTMSQINTVARGPMLYLLTLLVYQGGFSALNNISVDPQLQWIPIEDEVI
jgi:hypothetical protein